MSNIFKAIVMTMIMGLFIVRPAWSYADWQGHDGNPQAHNNGQNHYNGNGHDGWHGHSYRGVNLSVWPDIGYYGGPYYPPADEVLVSSPVYQPVVINGVTYYLCDGTYYIYNGYSYEPLASPPPVLQQAVTEAQPQTDVINQAGASSPVITTAGPAGDATDPITINIPNNKGGYTAVTLKKSGNGYIGPQGEFYPDFPKVAQLIVIYGK